MSTARVRITNDLYISVNPGVHVGILVATIRENYGFLYGHLERDGDIVLNNAAVEAGAVYNFVGNNVPLGQRSQSSSAVDSITDEIKYHIVRPLSEHPLYVHQSGTDFRARRRCQVDRCGEKASYYCLKCSQSSSETELIFTLCGPFVSNHKNCFYKHVCGDIDRLQGAAGVHSTTTT